jgi:zinc protease
MLRNRLVLTALFLLFLLPQFSNGQDAKNDFNLNSKLPVDPAMRTGTLKNGMRYYIRKNAKPEHRAEMRLAVHAGSVLESDSQQGLAHLTEHMAFNGTKNFSKSGIVDYLESIGIRFGADLNAYTSYDETVYMLQVPTDTMKFVTKGLQILEDWAHNVSFDNQEIDKERGVVIEEWRLGRGAFDRMSRIVDPIIYNNSLYADRSPIGKKNIIAYCKHDTLKKFYHDWYRPDLQAIVVVGDFDLDQMEKMVITQFSNIPEPNNPRPRPIVTIPSRKGTEVAIATDKESQYVFIQLQQRRDKMHYSTVNDYRDHIKQKLFTRLVSARLEELQHQANPPFSYASADIYSGLGQRSEYQVFAVTPDNNISGSLKTLISENEKIRRYGFTASELDRAKKNMLREIESMYKEKDKTDSRGLTDECVRNFLNGEDIMGIKNDYLYHEKFIPEINLDEVNALGKEWISDDDKYIVIQAPEKAGVKVPEKQEILAMVNDAKTEKMEAYHDVASDKMLLDKKPSSGKVIKETVNKEVGTTEWTLSNGAKVVLKPTDFKDDEILFGAYSPGGTSLVPDKDFVTCTNAPSIIDECGVAEFDANTLTKMLAGKNAGVSPYISDLYERFNGNASPKDVETMLQLLYLYFTSPKEDQNGFSSYLTKVNSFVQNQALSPEGVLRDSNQVITGNHHFRKRPYSTELLKEINEPDVMRLYRERFNDAGDFTFFFVGNFKPEELKPLIETYIGGLPSTGKKENWKDPGYTFPKGIVKKYVKKGTEPKSYVAITMKGDFDWNMKNKLDAEALFKVLNIMCRETMREDKSGVYGVGIGFTPARYPKAGYTINLQFGCAPENVDMLVNTAFEQMEKIKKEGPSAQNMEKVIETMHRAREVNLKDNRFWVNTLQGYYMNDDPATDILKYDEMVNKITAADIKKAAEKYLDTTNYVEVVLVPEK